MAAKGLSAPHSLLFLLKKEKIFLLLAINLGIILAASVALYLLEHGINKGLGSFFDAIYWAFISITTTGYGDITPVTWVGRLTAILVVFSGLVLFSLFTARVASVFVEEKIREGKGLETIKLKDHIVLCGWNRNADEVIEALLRFLPGQKVSLALLNELPEEEAESLRFKYRNQDFKFLRGDFAREDVLARANISQARSAIVLADTVGQHSLEKADERTILATLAIKSMAPGVKTCAELLNPENEQHLRRAKVDEIVIRGEHVGSLIAGATASPGLPRIISTLLSPQEENKLWKVEIPPGFVGKRVGELATYFREKHQALLMALLTEKKGLALENILTDDLSAIDQFIKRKFEEADLFGKKAQIVVTLNPREETILTEDDAVVVIARKKP